MTALPGTIRLLALDLDQTLFGDDLQVSPRVLGTVEQVQSRGVLVTIATVDSDGSQMVIMWYPTMSGVPDHLLEVLQRTAGQIFGT